MGFRERDHIKFNNKCNFRNLIHIGARWQPNSMFNHHLYSKPRYFRNIDSQIFSICSICKLIILATF